jgi:hypothetical protein
MPRTIMDAAQARDPAPHRAYVASHSLSPLPPLMNFADLPGPCGADRATYRVFGWRVSGAERSRTSFWGRLQPFSNLVGNVGPDASIPPPLL